MRRASRRSCLCVVLAMACCGLAAETSPLHAAEPVDFRRDIRPILARLCFQCHGAEKHENNLRLDSPQGLLRGGDSGEKLIVPGHSDKSELVRRISSTEDGVRMPPEGPPLSAEQVEQLRQWIDQGARGLPQISSGADESSEHWSYQRLRRPEVPPCDDPAVRNPIDAFIAAALRPRGLVLSPESDRVSLIRRLYFTVLGLPPAPEEIEAFTLDPRQDAYEQLVQRVLASPAYGERWARHWLDVVRFAETDGFEMNQERPTAYHYRDYVIAAFNDDKPYDQFVLEQLAGDRMGADVATGFLVAGPYDKVKSPDLALTLMQRQDELADIVGVTGSAFLATTVGCARCHNHKFDPITQADYYALQAVFAGVQHGERPLKLPADAARQREANTLAAHLAELKAALVQLVPLASTGRTIVLDDEAIGEPGSGEPQVRLLQNKAGHGANPQGSARGQRDDPGGLGRFPNISRGRYTWWQNAPGRDLLAYYPRAEGRFQLWLSWGCGFETHATDVPYLLDRDGDLATTADQQLLAAIDQQRFADGSGPIPNQPLWSGLRPTATLELTSSSCILVRAGQSDRPVTADVIVLQEVQAGNLPADPPADLPALREPVSPRYNVERFAPVSARFIRFTIERTNTGSEPCLDELEVFTPAAAQSPPRNVALDPAVRLTSSGDYAGDEKHQLAHVNDGRMGNERSWISNTPGRGFVQLELPQATLIEQIIWQRDRNEKYTDRLPVDYTIEVAQNPGQWQVVASASDRLPQEAAPPDSQSLRLARLSADERTKAQALAAEQKMLAARLQALTVAPAAYVGRLEQPGPTHRLYRGDPMQPREAVLADAPAVFHSHTGPLDLQPESPESERRLALARSIVHAGHPLTARVIVNRLWQYHFGTGIVATPSDFGRLGARPTHPELLDWLAAELIESGWSLKHIQRLILLSATYRQSNKPHAAGMQVDAAAALLWRFPPRRLEAEAMRDAILATSGTLDRSMYGPGFSVFEPNNNYVRVYEPKSQWDSSLARRMVYMQKVRMEQDPVFGAFDCPDAGLPAPRRSTSTNALQALNLLNSAFLIAQAERFAQRVQREAGDGAPDQVRRAFVLALGRAPDDHELQAACKLVAEHGLAALCRAMLNANEFLFIP